MKYVRRVAALVVTLCAAIVSIGTAAAESKLTLNRWLPPNHPFQTQILDPWIKAVERATSGRVKIEMTASSLSPPPRQYDLVRSGAVDVVFTFIGYTPDRFPVSTMTGLPFLGDTSEPISVAFWEIYQRKLAPAGEFRGVTLLGLASGPPGQIFTSKPVRTLSDYKGLKIRSADPVLSATITALGATPVFGPAPQSYEMLSTGVVDGGGFYFDSVVSFNIQRFVPHVVVHPGGLVNGAFFLAMNEAKWRSLSADDRAAIERVSGRTWAVETGRTLDRLEVAAKAALASAGTTFIVPDAAFAAEVRRVAEPVEADWLKQAAQAAGVDAKAALAEFRALIRDYRPGN